MRHFAIYARPWPCRVPLNGHSPSFLPTPREEATPVDNSTRRVTHKALPVLDRKLQAVASGHSTPKASSKRRPQSQEVDRPAKRAKLSSVHSTPTKSRKGQGNTVNGAEVTFSDSAKRKRGRPRIHFPEVKEPNGIKEEEESISLSSPGRQPRNSNGQFGRKDDTSNPTSPSKSSPNGSRPGEGITTPSGSPRNKRRVIDVDEKEHPRKRSLRGHRPDVAESLEDLPMQKVLPRSTGFRNIRLLSKPNPLSFALQAWRGPVVVDESSSSDEDEKGVATPDDDQSPPAATIVDLDDIVPSGSPSPAYGTTPILPRGALTYKPSPITFAKRRWASVSSDSPGRGQGTLELEIDSEHIVAENKDLPNDTLDQLYPYFKPDPTADESNEVRAANSVLGLHF